MTSVVHIVDQEELRARRAELLAAAGVEEAELRREAAEYMLSPEQVATLDEIDRIDYLLGA